MVPIEDKSNKKWNIKRGYSVYKSVYTEQIKAWIREGKIKRGEVFIWASGMSGWRRPEEVDQFKRLFKKKKK